MPLDDKGFLCDRGGARATAEELDEATPWTAVEITFLAELAAQLDALDAEHEVVVMIWQTSHVGAIVNEWADVEAGEALMDESMMDESIEGEVPILRVPGRTTI